MRSGASLYRLGCAEATAQRTLDGGAVRRRCLGLWQGTATHAAVRAGGCVWRGGAHAHSTRWGLFLGVWDRRRTLSVFLSFVGRLLPTRLGRARVRAVTGHPPPWGSGFTTGVLRWTWHSGMPQRRWIKPVRPRASQGKTRTRRELCCQMIVCFCGAWTLRRPLFFFALHVVLLDQWHV